MVGRNLKLNVVLVAQLVAAFGLLYMNHSFIFFIFVSFAMLSRMVHGFFAVNLKQTSSHKIAGKDVVRVFPSLVLMAGFFGWILKDLVGGVSALEAQQSTGTDEFFLRSPYLIVLIVFLIGSAAVAVGGVLRGYRQK